MKTIITVTTIQECARCLALEIMFFLKEIEDAWQIYHSTSDDDYDIGFELTTGEFIFTMTPDFYRKCLEDKKLYKYVAKYLKELEKLGEKINLKDILQKEI